MTAQIWSYYISSQEAQRGIQSVHHCCSYLSSYPKDRKQIFRKNADSRHSNTFCPNFCQSCFSEKVKQRAKVTIICAGVTNTRLACSSSSPFGSNPTSPGLLLVLCASSLPWPVNSETFNSVHTPKKENEWDWWIFKGYERAQLLNMDLCEGDPCCLRVANDNTLKHRLT